MLGVRCRTRAAWTEGTPLQTHDHAGSRSPLRCTELQLIMWQPDVVGGVAHFVMDCFDLLGAAPDAHDDGSSDSYSSSSALSAG